jgi:hypothetical protein
MARNGMSSIAIDARGRDTGALDQSGSPLPMTMAARGASVSAIPRIGH